MTSDLQAIAIEQRWCQSCPSGNLPTAGPVPWLGGPALMRPPGWRELRRKTCVCGNLHRAGALGHVFACTAPDLRRSRKAFRFRDRGRPTEKRPDLTESRTLLAQALHYCSVSGGVYSIDRRWLSGRSADDGGGGGS